MKKINFSGGKSFRAGYMLAYLAIAASLVVLLWGGYRLLTFDPVAQASLPITKVNLMQTSLQGLSEVVDEFEANSMKPDFRSPLPAALDGINAQWRDLVTTESFSRERSALVTERLNELTSTITARAPSGKISLVDNLFVKPVLDSLESLKPELQLAYSAPLTANQIRLLTAAIVILALGLLSLIYLNNNEAKVRLAKSQEENALNQSAILRLLDELADLADGDLTISATVSEDFTGAIADSINFTIDQLRQLVSRINDTSYKVSTASQESRQTALHLAEASDHQAQEIAGASAAINEMAVTIDQVSSNAAESALVAGKSVSIANNGAKLVQNTMQGMDTIREQIQDTSKRIKRLGESSQEIGDIVSLINDIADQTNILALNAAIQASMAGDAGRGFAVVADEVQRLAERSAAATKQIETLVNTIQADTNEAVISMEQTTSEVVKGARLAQDAGVALEEIEGVSVNLAELIQNISNAARQQAASAGHISNTMNVIQEITSQTSSGTSETADQIGELASMASELRESVSDFTLPGGANNTGAFADTNKTAAAETISFAEEIEAMGLEEDVDDFFSSAAKSTDVDLDLSEELDLSEFENEGFNKSAI